MAKYIFINKNHLLTSPFLTVPLTLAYIPLWLLLSVSWPSWVWTCSRFLLGAPLVLSFPFFSIWASTLRCLWTWTSTTQIKTDWLIDWLTDWLTDWNFIPHFWTLPAKMLAKLKYNMTHILERNLFFDVWLTRQLRIAGSFRMEQVHAQSHCSFSSCNHEGQRGTAAASWGGDKQRAGLVPNEEGGANAEWTRRGPQDK